MRCVIIGDCPQCHSQIALTLSYDDPTFGTPGELRIQPTQAFHAFNGNPTWCGCSCELTPPETYVIAADGLARKAGRVLEDV